MKSVMSHNFSQVPRAEIQRSSFDRSHAWKGTFDASHLIPILVDEVLPGDTHSLQCNTFARLATPIVPFMDNLYADTFFFFVPTRLVWDNWEKFNGAQDNPDDSTDFLVPVLDNTSNISLLSNSVFDYMGLPAPLVITAGSNYGINSLPFRAYNLIWNEWFRDQNLQDSVVVDRDDGPDNGADYVSTLRRGKRYDYFTSCLPWPQKGDPVTLPLGTSADIFRKASAGPQTYYVAGTASTDMNTGNATYVTNSSTTVLQNFAGTFGSMDPRDQAGNSTLYADLTNATAATINSIREAFQVQRLLERDARGGTRYVEILLAHFGVTAPDFRLQRPEYLGGSSTKVNVNPVAQTSSTDATTPQGNLAAVGSFAHSGRNGFSKSFVEHGYIIGLLSVRADLTYQNGLDRMWTRSTRYDFYWPALAHLGEQAVLKQELFMSGTPATDAEVFGYQERYAEYRYKKSNVTGLFRSLATSNLDEWHLSQQFLSAVLNEEFIQDSTAEVIDRVIATPSEPQFLCDVFFNYRSARPMPTYSVPGFIDRF